MPLNYTLIIAKSGNFYVYIYLITVKKIYGSNNIKN